MHLISDMIFRVNAAAMAPIDRALFLGDSDLDPTILPQLEVADYGDAVTNALRFFKWDGQAVSCIVLELSPDNKRVTSGSLEVKGPLQTGDIKLKASTLWANAPPEVSLVIRVPDGGGFGFDDGSLCSDYLPSEEISHSFSHADGSSRPTVITAAEHSDYGVGPFCLRLVCHIIRATPKSGVILRYSVVAYPGTRDDLMDVSELAQSPCWPGLLLADGDMQLAPLPHKPWQCPVLPFFRTGTPWGEEPVIPSASELRRAIGSIMARSTPPELYKTRAGIMRNWEKYANNPDEFVQKRSPLTWPEPDRAEPTTG